MATKGGGLVRRGKTPPAWYGTWWGVLATCFFALAAALLIWGHGAKPGWLKIEVANGDVALLTVALTGLFLLALRIRVRMVTFLFGLLWLLFLPNTAYVLTDLGHLPYQWDHMAASGHWLLVVQYLLLTAFALMTFIFSFFPFEIIMVRVRAFQKRQVPWLIFCNFLVAYGMILGRYEHINSQVLFTHPQKVVQAAAGILASGELLALTLFYGALCSAIYLLFRGVILPGLTPYLRIE